MKYDVFISYSRKDAEIVDKIESELKKRRISTFLDRTDIMLGKDFAEDIARAIYDCRIFLFVWSENSNQSENTANEISLAIEFEKTVISFKIGAFKPDFKLAYRLTRLNRMDISAISDIHILELVDKISNMMGIKNPVIKEDISSPISTITKDSNTQKLTLKFKPDVDCIVYIDDEKVLEAPYGRVTKLQLGRGSYSLKVVSKLSDIVFVEQEYIVDEVGIEKIYVVKLFNQSISFIPDSEIERFISNGLIGYRYNGRVIIEAQYKWTQPFSDNLALVKNREGNLYYINKLGEKMPIKIQKGTSYWSFECGMAKICLSGKYGFIDKNGNEIIHCKYDNAGAFYDDIACVCLSGKYGYINTFGEEVTPLKYDCESDFSEGLASVKLNGKYGFIDKFGKEVIPLKFDSALSFSEGLACVKLNGKYGFIDKSGIEVTLLKYDSHTVWFREGFARVKLNGKYGFINRLGEEVVPLRYDSVVDFHEGLAGVGLNDKYGFIDAYGNEIVPLKYDSVGIFSDGLARVKLGGKIGFINTLGIEIIPLKYDSGYAFEGGVAYVELNMRCGLINKLGKEVTSLKYDKNDWSLWNNGLINIELNGKKGFLDKDGNEKWNE